MNKHEVVVITGASAGVGRAAAHAFAKREWAYIGLIARGEERLQETRAEVERLGGKGLVLPCDVADPKAIESAADKVERELGPIDVWVNSAMTTIFSPLIDISAEEFRRATEVTYLGTVHGTMAALKRMAPRNHGSIVQVGSALAYRSIPIQAPYCGAKFAIRGFTDALRTELIHDKSNIHITMVQMPALNTPQFSWCMIHLPKEPRPVAPVYQPEVAAEAIVWAAHHRRREIFVGISSAAIIWANKLIPGLLDRYLANSAVEGQQTERVPSPDRADNLFEPVAGDFGTHGAFGSEAHSKSPQLWINLHRGWIAATLAALIIAYFVL
jgi:short-subunit dehydrogenase